MLLAVPVARAVARFLPDLLPRDTGAGGLALPPGWGRGQCNKQAVLLQGLPEAVPSLCAGNWHLACGLCAKHVLGVASFNF